MAARAKQKPESEFDQFRKELLQYEALILKHQGAQTEVERIGKELVDLRNTLFKRKVSLSIDAAVPIRRQKRAKVATAGDTKLATAEQVLDLQDPRVKRSLQPLVRVLFKWAEPMDRNQLARALKISKGALGLRTAKALELGLVKRVGRGVIALS